jgi:putative oxygen-independent coproporphyrinogen III oxidase
MIDHPTRDAGFGVYVHWPFCLSKCPYCDFNSHVRQKPVDEARFLAAFRREIAHAAALAPGRTVTSVFFGGGTPSLMAPATAGAILDAIAAAWPVDEDVEITLEANPTSVEATRFRGYRAAGVNRVSLGVQALDDADLRRLGRTHTAAEALAAVEVAAKSFERFSFDLIYARPEQTPEQWAAELREAIAHAAEHLSLYQLTIEPGTWFERLHAAGKLVVPDHEAARRLYDLTQEVCEAHGLPAYEISNHARPGTESWLGEVEAQGHGLVESQALTPEEQGDEFLLMGLRLREGIEPARYAALAGRPLDLRRIESLLGDGLIARRIGTRLAVTPAGFPVLDAVVADLAA